MTDSGIVIARQYTPLPVKGRIVALGSGRLTKKGLRLPHVAGEGDIVVFAQRAGEEIIVEGHAFVMVREDDLLAKIDWQGSTRIASRRDSAGA